MLFPFTNFLAQHLPRALENVQEISYMEKKTIQCIIVNIII